MTPRHFLSIDDVSAGQLLSLLDDADRIKKKPEAYAEHLAGKQVALLFEKASTRTRVSFEVAIASMGANAIALRGDELQLVRGESLEDTGVLLSLYVDAIVLRTFGQDRLERLADASSVPVINALTDHCHPCQCVADLQTVREKKGDLQGVALAYVGDGNNVAHSLMLGGARTGMDVRIASPEGYEPHPAVVEAAARAAADSGGRLTLTHDAEQAAAGADALYTDVWASMGQEEDIAARREAFAPYQVNESLVELADEAVIVMHCLPAHRGEEISSSVLHGPRSVVWEQAENRLHSQKALLAWLLG